MAFRSKYGAQVIVRTAHTRKQHQQFNSGYGYPSTEKPVQAQSGGDARQYAAVLAAQLRAHYRA